MSAEDDGKDSGTKAHAGKCTLPPHPGEDAKLHLAQQWRERSETILAAHHLLDVAMGGLPIGNDAIIDIDLDLIPPLPADDAGAEKRRMERVMARRTNEKNEAQRFKLLTDAWTELFTAVCKSLESSDEHLVRELKELCDLRTQGLTDRHGLYDGPAAWRLALARLPTTDGERTTEDTEFYELAMKLQKEHPLPTGASGEDYWKRASTFIAKIKPNLERTMPDVKASDYVKDLMPHALRQAGRQIKDKMESEGTYLDLWRVARNCRKVVQEEASKPKPSPALVTITDDECGGFRLKMLAEISGIALNIAADGGGGKPIFAAVKPKTPGAFTPKKGVWCPRCPDHGREPGRLGPDSCMYNPGYDGPWPVSVWTVEEKKKNIETQREKISASTGVPLKYMSPPTEERIKAYKARRGGRLAGRGGGRGSGRGTPGAVAVNAHDFLDSLQDIGDADMMFADLSTLDLAVDASPPTLSFPAVSGDVGSEDGADDDGMVWFVVIDTEGEFLPNIQAAHDKDQLDIPDRSRYHEVEFFDDEAAARAYAERFTAELRKKALAAAAALTSTPSNGSAPSTPPSWSRVSDSLAQEAAQASAAGGTSQSVDGGGSCSTKIKTSTNSTLFSKYKIAPTAPPVVKPSPSAGKQSISHASKSPAPSQTLVPHTPTATSAATGPDVLPPGLKARVRRGESVESKVGRHEPMEPAGDDHAGGHDNEPYVPYEPVVASSLANIAASLNKPLVCLGLFVVILVASVLWLAVSFLFGSRSTTDENGTVGFLGGTVWRVGFPLVTLTIVLYLSWRKLPPRGEITMSTVRLAVSLAVGLCLFMYTTGTRLSSIATSGFIGITSAAFTHSTLEEGAGPLFTSIRRLCIFLGEHVREVIIVILLGWIFAVVSGSSVNRTDETPALKTIIVDRQVVQASAGWPTALQALKPSLPLGEVQPQDVVASATRWMAPRGHEANVQACASCPPSPGHAYDSGDENETAIVQCGVDPYETTTFAEPHPPSPPPSPPATSIGERLSSKVSSIPAYVKERKLPVADYLTHDECKQLHLELLAGHEQPPNIPDSIKKTLCIADSGAGTSMGNHRDQFKSGTLKSATAEVYGASGSFKTDEKGLFQYPMESQDGKGIFAYRESNAILNTSCPYILFAIGRASREQGVSTVLPPWGQDGYFEFPSGVRVTLYNRFVYIVRPIGYKVSPSIGLVASGNDTMKKDARSMGFPDDGDYVIYLGSGPRRKGDMTDAGKLTGLKAVVIHIDVKVGGQAHNFMVPSVMRTLLWAASNERCICVLVSINCKTFSVAHFLPKKDGTPGTPMRSYPHHVLGKPGDDGVICRAVLDANVESAKAVELCRACVAHGGEVLVETPVLRDPTRVLLPKHALTDAEGHTYMFDLPVWKAFMADFETALIPWDQCCDADDPSSSNVKATVWLATGRLAAPVKAKFEPKQCEMHDHGGHKALRGTDADGNYVTSPSAAYHPKTNVSIVECILVLQDSDNDTASEVVIHGKHLPRKAVTGRFLHRITDHCEHRLCRLLPKAWRDAEDWWIDKCVDEPCDACLRGDAPRVAPSGSLPCVKGLIFIDIMHVSIVGKRTGCRNVLGLIEATTGFEKSMCIPRKSDAPAAIDLCTSFLHSKGYVCAHLHCDGAHELKGSGVVALARERQWRITTSLPGHSRQNRREPGWRHRIKEVRKALVQANLTDFPELWDFAWSHVEEGAMLRPVREPPHLSKLGQLIASCNKSHDGLVQGSHRRPFGALCYPGDAPRLPSGTLVNKVKPQAERMLHMGYYGGESGSFERLTTDNERAQPGYICLDEQGQFVITDNVRFCPNTFPGLKRVAGGGLRIPIENIPFIDQSSGAKQAGDKKDVLGDGGACQDGGVHDVAQESDLPELAQDSNVLNISKGFAPEEDVAKKVAPIAQDKIDPATTKEEESDPFEIVGKRLLIDWPKYGGEFAGECVGWRRQVNGTVIHHIIYDNPNGTWKQSDIDRWHNLLQVKWRLEPNSSQEQDAPDTPVVQHDVDHDATGVHHGVELDLDQFKSALDKVRQGKLDEVEPIISSLYSKGVKGISMHEAKEMLREAREFGGYPNADPQERQRAHDSDKVGPRRSARIAEAEDKIAAMTAAVSTRLEERGFATAALAARNVEFHGLGYDVNSHRLPLAALHVDLEDQASRVKERAFVFHEIKTGLSPFAYAALVQAEYESLDEDAQRAIAIAMDHADVCEEYGVASPQADMARKMYAAAMVQAATGGIRLPALQPLLSAANDDGISIDPDDLFKSAYDGKLFAHPYANDVISEDLFNAATRSDFATVAKKKKQKSSPNIFTERQMMGPEWDEPKAAEIAKLERMKAFTKIPADDPSIKGVPITPSMWTGRAKIGEDGEVSSLSGRCVLRGDLYKVLHSVTANEATSPVVAVQGLGAVDAVGVLREQKCINCDVSGAYLQGNPLKKVVIVRPPPGYREYDERGIEILWRMNIYLYGQVDAGSNWNDTFNEFATACKADSLDYERCPQEPGVYSKQVGDGDPKEAGRKTLPLYVDDYKIYHDCDAESTASAKKDLEKLKKRFEQKEGEWDAKETFFLGANRVAHSSQLVTVKPTAYIKTMAKRYLPGDLEAKDFPSAWSYTPADDTLVKAYEAAVVQRPAPPQELREKYGSLYGSLLHATKYRGDIAAALGRLGTCLTICTEELYECLVRVLVYLIRTKDLGITYSAHVADAGKLKCYADSDWSTTRSTTGYCIMLAGSVVSQASRRQHCISMSSCEAELIALADAAIELLYISAVCSFIGWPTDGAIEVCTDNKAAYDLCHRYTAAQHTKHIDRKMFKMRELRGAGIVEVKHIPGETNPADLYTKVLSRQPFEKHRKTTMNLSGDTGAEFAQRMRALGGKP